MIVALGTPRADGLVPVWSLSADGLRFFGTWDPDYREEWKP